MARIIRPCQNFVFPQTDNTELETGMLFICSQFFYCCVNSINILETFNVEFLIQCAGSDYPFMLSYLLIWKNVSD